MAKRVGGLKELEKKLEAVAAKGEADTTRGEPRGPFDLPHA